MAVHGWLKNAPLPGDGGVGESYPLLQPLEPRLLLAGAVPSVDLPVGPVEVVAGQAETVRNLLYHFSNPDLPGMGPIYEFDGTHGTFYVHLFETDTPITVANFRAYADAGDYDGTFFHRSVNMATAGVHVVQGGGFVINGAVSDVPSRGMIQNEPGISNTRGTIAMAKGADPDSASSQWYFNVSDNTVLDDPDLSGGFTVFGDVLADGMDVIDAIAALPLVNAGSPAAGQWVSLLVLTA